MGGFEYDNVVPEHDPRPFYVFTPDRWFSRQSIVNPRLEPSEDQATALAGVPLVVRELHDLGPASDGAGNAAAWAVEVRLADVVTALQAVGRASAAELWSIYKDHVEQANHAYKEGGVRYEMGATLDLALESGELVEINPQQISDSSSHGWEE